MLVRRRQVLQGAAALAASTVLPSGARMAWADEKPERISGKNANSTGPWVFWYWMNGNVTREGIAADLDAMHAAGIEGVYLFNVGGVDSSTLVEHPAESQSPLWWDMLRFAAGHARDLGLSMAMNVCDGWGTAGGAWITPEISAQEIVWTEAIARPGVDTHQLAQPATRLGFYKDVAAFAFPIPTEWLATHEGLATVSSSWPIDAVSRVGDPQQATLVIDTDQAGWLQYSFAKPFTLRSLTVRNPTIPILPFLSLGYSGAANSFGIEVSEDGATFKRAFTLVPPQLGWQANAAELTHSIPPTTARHFRFVYHPDEIALVSGDGHFTVGRRLALASLVLSGRPVVNQLPIKSGKRWGVTLPMDEALLPARDCIPADRIVDVSAHLQPDGTLRWRAPRGQWAILRIGSTSNGVPTAPSGKAGGLECDKFSVAAVTTQFEGWFGEALRQVGPDLAGKVLQVLHIDSWEGQSQNWSPVFATEFRARRGYDLRLYLPILAGVPIGSADRTERFLFDVRRTVGDLLRDHCFATLSRLAHEHGCVFSAQATNASFIGDGIQNFQHVDLPCGEFWKGRPASDKPSDVAEAVAGARLYGKSRAVAEAFTGQLDWSEHPFSFKAQGDQQFCLGINRFILHVWAHQALEGRYPGITMYGYGSFFSRTQPWWPMAGAWIAYLSRCQGLLQRGRAVVDVCYYVGEDVPSRAYLASALRPQLPAGYAFDSINADALLRLAAVSAKRIVLPSGASYALMVLPGSMPVSLRVARKLRELVEAGAAIVGSRPRPSPTLEDEEAAIGEASAILDVLWRGASDPNALHVLGAGRSLMPSSNPIATVLGDLGIGPDVEIQGAEPVSWIHRRDGVTDVYFFSNPQDQARSFATQFRIENGRPACYEAVTDRWTLTEFGTAEGRTEVYLTLAPAGSIFVVFGVSQERIGGIGGPVWPAPDVAVEGGKLVARVRTSGRWTMMMTRYPQAIEAKLPPPLQVKGPWRVKFESPTRSFARHMTALKLWNLHDADPEVQFFSGLGHYVTEFVLRSPREFHWHLDPGVFADILSVTLNGQDLGVLWVPGSDLDVTPALRPGRNKLEIIVANTWRNRLVGDRGLPSEARSSWIMPNRLGRAPVPAVDSSAPLVSAGLLGPVRLVPVQYISLDDR